MTLRLAVNFQNYLCFGFFFHNSVQMRGVCTIFYSHLHEGVRILEGIAFLRKLRPLLFKPHWDYQI